MAAYSGYIKALLSGSTNGKSILITQTASAGDTIHTATASTTAFDEVWLYAYNSSASSVVLTIQFGGTTTPDNDTKVTVPPTAGRLLVIDGRLLNNSLVVKAYAGTTNVITIDGFINQVV